MTVVDCTAPLNRYRPTCYGAIEVVAIIIIIIIIIIITAMRRWPRDQKSKPEVNSRDVIKWTS